MPDGNKYDSLLDDSVMSVARGIVRFIQRHPDPDYLDYYTGLAKYNWATTPESRAKYPLQCEPDKWLSTVWAPAIKALEEEMDYLNWLENHTPSFPVEELFKAGRMRAFRFLATGTYLLSSEQEDRGETPIYGSI
jgi:hypothetical protein